MYMCINACICVYIFEKKDRRQERIKRYYQQRYYGKDSIEARNMVQWINELLPNFII